MVLSERHQLLGMFKFIDGNNLGKHLKNKNWLSFALGYNGQNAEANGYPHKLERRSTHSTAEAHQTFQCGSLSSR